jgi:hypothetical protein
VAKDTKKDLDLDAKDAADVKGGQSRPDSKRPDMTKPGMTKSVKRPGIKKV